MIKKDSELDRRWIAICIAKNCRVGAIATIPDAVGSSSRASPDKSIVLTASDRVDSSKIDLVAFIAIEIQNCVPCRICRIGNRSKVEGVGTDAAN